MELDSAMAEELKEKAGAAWVPLTPAKYEINSIDKCLNHDVGSVENPQLSQIQGKLGHSGKDGRNSGSELGHSGSACCGRDNQDIAKNCDGFVSNTGAPIDAKNASNSGKRVPRKVGFESLGLHGKPESIKDNLKMRSTDGIDALNTKPRKRMRMRMKRHRPKVFDESKPIKPSTPKPRTPKPARYVKKKVDPLKDDDGEAIRDFGKQSCKLKLDFNKESCIMDQKNLKPYDGINNISEVEPKLQSGSRILIVYRRVLRPNECLKNSRKLGPIFPKVFKKRRMMRQRIAIATLDKLIGLIKMIPAKYEPPNSYPAVKDRKNKSRKKKSHQSQKSSRKRKSRQSQKYLSGSVSTIVELSWMNLKRKRSKTLTRRREFSSFLAAHVEVQDEGVQHVAAKESTEKYLSESVSTIVNLSWMNLRRKRSKRLTRRREFSSFLAAHVEVQDEGVQHVAVKESVEHCKHPQDDVVSYNGNIQNCSAEFGGCIRGVEEDIPEHSLEFNTSFQQQEDIMCKSMDLSYESKNVFSCQDNDAVTEALVDFATQKMESLHIDDGSNQLVVRDQNAYGAVVPSKEKIDPSKSRKPLPKVDLDPETMRVWNLLMENNGSEATEEEDDDKAKYWEEQRELFRGRVDSFIARMHLIQGDRRFSPWKGSVVDSVVGVFLTQNVSDHLSSSAFMSLAAKYPPPSVSEHNGWDGRSDCVIHETQQVKIAEPPSGKCEESNPSDQVDVDLENGNNTCSQTEATPGTKKGKVKDKQENTINWDELRKKSSHGISRNRTKHNADSVNWEAVRQASVGELAKVIEERGMNNMLAKRIKDFLDRLVRDHGSIDLEWLRDVPPDKAKEYLLSIPGLGLKSVECVRLLSLHHHAFPVDTNIGRVFVRLGWVPLQPLPEDVQIHLLNQYPMLDSIQKYLWPRMCNRDKSTLYECHCQGITFAKSFCTKIQPNCNACPMRGECRHYASAFASARLRLEGSRAKNMETESSTASSQEAMVNESPPMLVNSDGEACEGRYTSRNSEPIVEFPASPDHASIEPLERDIEDFDCESEIPTVILNGKEFSKTWLDEDADMSKALVNLSHQGASIPMPKLKYVDRLRTVHLVYELPDSHPLLATFEKREREDPCPYLLAIWPIDEIIDSSQESKKACNTEGSTTCDVGTCFSGEIVQYQKDQIVKGTILIPCRTANRGSFPLNGTYFQVNEVFADHESSRRPINVPREWIWNLGRRALYCGTSTTSICRGMSLEEIVCTFWKGFICIRGFDMRTRGARPLAKRFHVCKSRQPDNE